MNEVCYGADHKFLTCVANHQTGGIVWATEGRNTASLQAFFDGLTPRAEGLDQGCVDRHVRRL